MDRNTLKKTAQRLAQTLDTLADLRTAAEVAAEEFEARGIALPEQAVEVTAALDVVGPYVARQLALAHKLVSELSSDGSDDLLN